MGDVLGEDRALKIWTNWGSGRVKLDLWGKNGRLNLGGQIRGGEAAELSSSQNSGPDFSPVLVKARFTVRKGPPFCFLCSLPLWS